MFTIIPFQSVSPQPSSSWGVCVCRLAGPRTLAACWPCGGWCCCLCQRCCSRAPRWSASPSSGSVRYRSTSAVWRWRSSTRTKRTKRMTTSAGSAAKGENTVVTVAPTTADITTVRTMTARGRTSRHSERAGVCVAMIQGFPLFVCVCVHATAYMSICWLCK